MLKYFYDHTLPEQFFVLSEFILKESIFKFFFIIGYICKFKPGICFPEFESVSCLSLYNPLEWYVEVL